MVESEIFDIFELLADASPDTLPDLDACLTCIGILVYTLRDGPYTFSTSWIELEDLIEKK